jgi:magnesium transporter
MGLYLFLYCLIAVLSDDVTIFDRGKDMSNILGGLPELLIRLLARTVSQFLSHIRTISMLVNELEEKLKTTVENKHLLHMFKLNQSMTYYMSALSANSALIDRLRVSSAKIGFTAEHNELLEDLSVDSAQCYKQAEIYSVLLGGLMDARTGVINNNLNLMMKHLTILTVIFLPLNVIASVFGMSEFTRFVEGFYDPAEISHLFFCVSYLLFGVGLVVISYLTYWLLKWFRLD